MLHAALYIFLILLGYLSGSICSAVIVSRIFSLPDPRAEGSQNPGATNVLRLAGKKYAVIVLLGDVIKGLLPVLLGQLFGVAPVVLGFICLSAVVGHMYPAFFEFKGGKGVATALGGLLGINLILGVEIIALWLLVANFSRHSSLASLVALTFAPICAIVTLGNLNIFIPLMIISVLIVFKHRDNITRLFAGTEPKIQLRRHQITDVADDLIDNPEDR